MTYHVVQNSLRTKVFQVRPPPVLIVTAAHLQTGVRTFDVLNQIVMDKTDLQYNNMKLFLGEPSIQYQISNISNNTSHFDVHLDLSG